MRVQAGATLPAPSRRLALLTARFVAAWVAAFMATAAAPAAADSGLTGLAGGAEPALDAAAAAPVFKLTLGVYGSSDHNPARDINLRGTQGAQTAWLGIYRDRSGFQQWRSGYELRGDGDTLRSVLSLQSASGGAAVASVSAELGGATYAIVGWGRTNLRNYVNLNYDPNDAITFGIGSRAWAGSELSLFQVRDDRLHTGQQVTHLVLRQHLASGQRLSLDLFYKRGLTGDGNFVRAASCSLGWDVANVFVRFVHDPHAGFATPTQDRLSFGIRF